MGEVAREAYLLHIGYAFVASSWDNLSDIEKEAWDEAAHASLRQYVERSDHEDD